MSNARLTSLFLFAALTAVPVSTLAQSTVVIEGTVTFGAVPAPSAPVVAPLAPAPVLAPMVGPPVVASAAPQTLATTAPPPEASPELARPRTTRDWRLVGAGAGLALGSYVLNLVGTLFWVAIPNGASSIDPITPTWNHREELFFWSLVPVAGPLAQIGYAEEDWQVGLFIGSSLLQIAGFAMAIAGTARRIEVTPREGAAPAPGVSVVPYASSTGAGLTVAGTF